MSSIKSHDRNNSNNNHTTPPSSLPCNPNSNTQRKTHTWLLTPGTTHFAKNRSSFKSYRRAPTKIAGSRILGVGTVELTVRAGPEENENRPNTLVLENVLHIPRARCNGLCLGRWREGNPGCDVEVLEGGEGRCRCWVSGDSGEGEDVEEGEVGEDGCEFGNGHGHGHGHGEALWYGEGYRGGGSRVVLWGDERGRKEEDLDEIGGVDVRGVNASAEELDTLYTRVRQRSLN
ncbi:hypothetical protein BDV12DRAFT_199360 [Aspergillus spectabilis]